MGKHSAKRGDTRPQSIPANAPDQEPQAGLQEPNTPAAPATPPAQEPSTPANTPAQDASLLGTAQEPSTPAGPQEPPEAPLPAGTIRDASGRPNPFLAACNARWAASSWDGHTKRIGTAGGPGTGTPAQEPARCYGCNRPWRVNQEPVVGADGNVWHNLCATVKDGGPGLPRVVVARPAPVVARAAAPDPALLERIASQDAQLSRMAALLERLLGADQEPPAEGKASA